MTLLIGNIILVIYKNIAANVFVNVLAVLNHSLYKFLRYYYITCVFVVAGLFHGVIAHSGSALNAWNTNAQKNTGVLAAKFLGFEGSEMTMLPFLQSVSFEEILKVQDNTTLVRIIITCEYLNML